MWMDSPESSMPVSLLSSCPSLCRLLPNLVDNLVNRVLANVLPDLVREGLCLQGQTGGPVRWKEPGMAPLCGLGQE